MSYYFLINLASISIPLIVGFDRRLKFYKKWKYLFPAMLGTMVVFIPWDMLKTSIGVWGFNPRYLQGIYLYNLPIEEVLFFIAIPYACLFTYHSFDYFGQQSLVNGQKSTNNEKKGLFQWLNSKPQFFKVLSICLSISLLVIGLLNISRTYTSVTFIATGVFLLWHTMFVKDNYLGMFYFTYLIILIPFFMVNGALTGMFTPEPVVWYNDSENLGIRLGTIPIEDTLYGLLLILMNTTIYEALKK